MSDAVIEITRSELAKLLSKIFSCIPEGTPLKITNGELADTLNSLFKIKGPCKEIISLQPDESVQNCDIGKILSENNSFEYVTLEEAVEKTELNIKYLLRGGLTNNYLLYHFYGKWWPVPIIAINDLYNGKENVSCKIWYISKGKWLQTQLSYVEPLNEKWGKAEEPVKEVSLTIASLHIREDDLKKIIDNPELLEKDQFYMSDELQLAVACSRELYPTAPPEASTPGEKKTNAQAENKKINEWLQKNGVKGKRRSERIRIMVNPYTD